MWRSIGSRQAGSNCLRRLSKVTHRCFSKTDLGGLSLSHSQYCSLGWEDRRPEDRRIANHAASSSNSGAVTTPGK